MAWSSRRLPWSGAQDKRIRAGEKKGPRRCTLHEHQVVDGKAIDLQDAPSRFTGALPAASERPSPRRRPTRGRGLGSPWDRQGRPKGGTRDGNTDVESGSVPSIWLRRAIQRFLLWKTSSEWVADEGGECLRPYPLWCATNAGINTNPPLIEAAAGALRWAAGGQCRGNMGHMRAFRSPHGQHWTDELVARHASKRRSECFTRQRLSKQPSKHAGLGLADATIRLPPHVGPRPESQVDGQPACLGDDRFVVSCSSSAGCELAHWQCHALRVL